MKKVYLLLLKNRCVMNKKRKLNKKKLLLFFFMIVFLIMLILSAIKIISYIIDHVPAFGGANSVANPECYGFGTVFVP